MVGYITDFGGVSMLTEKKAVSRYITYTDGILKEIIKRHKELDDSILVKQNHGLIMKDSVRNITKNSNMLNETYLKTAALEGLFHDIGRFKQYLLSKTLDDNESKKYTGFDDHGKYGRYLLEKNDNKLLRYFLGQESNYDTMFLDIVGEHTTITNPNYLCDISGLKDTFKDYSFDEIINSSNEELKNKLTALKLKILREADSLEIFDKIINGLWKPTISNDEEKFVNTEIWEKFINFEYIDMKDLKERGLWTANAGFLLRYGLLFQNFNLVGTLKKFIESDSFEKLWKQTEENSIKTNGSKVQDSKVIEAQDYIKKAIECLISESDGILIDDDTRKRAKEKIKTLK